MKGINYCASAYLQLSEAYEDQAAAARELGWPVAERASHHLAPLTDSALVANRWVNCSVNSAIGCAYAGGRPSDGRMGGMAGAGRRRGPDHSAGTASTAEATA